MCWTWEGRIILSVDRADLRFLALCTDNAKVVTILFVKPGGGQNMALSGCRGFFCLCSFCLPRTFNFIGSARDVSACAVYFFLVRLTSLSARKSECFCLCIFCLPGAFNFIVSARDVSACAVSAFPMHLTSFPSPLQAISDACDNNESDRDW